MFVHADTSLHGSNNCEDYTISFVITCQRQPLLLLDAGFSSDFQATWARESANRQIIYYLDVVGLTNQHADRLYAISTVGKKWRAMYSMGSHGGRSVKGIAAVNSLRSAIPECWNSDITSEASWEALKGIVETIKGYNA